MTGQFGRSQNSGFSVRSNKEKFLFIAAAGAALAVILVFLLVAIVKSGANSGNSGSGAQSNSEPTQLQPEGTVGLIAPESEVPAGTKLSDVRFKRVTWPRNQIPEGAFTDPSEVAPLYAKVKLPANVPVQRINTTSQAELPRVAPLALTPGNRAISIEVDDTSGLEGHALPGSRVDVVLTFNQSGTLISNIIVQNARVLSYGGDTTPGTSLLKDHKPAKISRTLTLDVAPGDALKIQTARQMGRLSLIMRAPEDDAAAPVTSFAGQDLQVAKSPKVVNQPVCSRGKMKMGGKEYLIGCDGSMSPVE